MTILPVLDLLDGLVVRGVAGDRQAYRPIQSRLTASSQPLDVARAFRESLGLSHLYLADLDAIVREQPSWSLYEALAADGFTLWIDAGLRDVATGRRLRERGASAVIAGLETWPDPQSLAELCLQLGAERVVFSLDLKCGAPLGDARGWESVDPFEIGIRACHEGVSQMIVLDLAGVGVGQGLSTLPLCRRLRAARPDLRLITGGGIRDASDLRRLTDEPVEAVLVASALHDGRLSRADLEALHRPPTTHPSISHVNNEVLA